MKFFRYFRAEIRRNKRIGTYYFKCRNCGFIAVPHYHSSLAALDRKLHRCEYAD